eukprot:Nk52_evm1s895 gene=Nk52_evmTU1s895
MGNYRPISLLSHVMKIITSIFLNRLNKVIDDIVPPQQNGFILGRNILDNVLNVLTAKNYAKGGIITLVDFKKAFDMMRHDYMELVLREVGCPEEFRKWIKVLRNETSGSVKINGSCSEATFSIDRGVRQGDPISGLLFAIATLPLIMGLERCRGISWKIGNHEFKLKQSDYADDTAIMSRDEEDRRKAVRCIEVFCDISGMELNYGKCIVIPFGNQYVELEVGRDGMQWLKDTQCTKYLGHYI